MDGRSAAEVVELRANGCLGGEAHSGIRFRVDAVGDLLDRRIRAQLGEHGADLAETLLPMLEVAVADRHEVGEDRPVRGQKGEVTEIPQRPER